MNTMNRRRRTRILVLSGALRRDWAAAIRQTRRVEILEPPRAGLVMAQVRESARKMVFALGEVLVTEAKARVDGRVGLGLVRGWDEAAAEDLAVIDAACRAATAAEERWSDRLVEAEAALEAELAAERRRLEATRVDFQTMDQGGGQ